MSASEAVPASAAKSGISKEQVKEAFDLFDADGSGTIDRDELRVLCFSLGRTMTDEQLEQAFEELDADGNGSIEYSELEAFILEGEDQDEGSAPALLRLALRKQLLAAKAKDVMSRLGSSSANAPKGTMDINIGVSSGDTFEGKDMHGILSMPEVACGLKFTVQPDIAGQSSSEMGEQDEEGGTLQFVIGLTDDANLDALADAAEALTAVAENLLPMAQEVVPISRVAISPPCPSPIAGHTGQVIILSIHIASGMEDGLEALQELADELPGMDEAMDSDSEDGEASDSDGEYKGRKFSKKTMVKVLQRVLAKFQVEWGCSATLAQLTGQDSTYTGGAVHSAFSFEAKLSKSVLHVLQSISLYGLLKDSWITRSQIKHFGRMGTLGSVDCIDTRSHLTSEQMRAVCSLLGIQKERDSAGDFANPTRAGVFHAQAFFQHMVEQGFESEGGSVVNMVASTLRGTAAPLAEGMPAPSFPSIQEAVSSVEAALEEGDVEEALPAVATAAAFILAEMSKGFASLQCVRLSAIGLVAQLEAKGFHLQPLLATQASGFETGTLIKKQMEGEAVIPGMLLLAPSPALAATVRGATGQGVHDKGSFFVPEWTMLKEEWEGYSQSLLLPGIGNVDYVEPFTQDAHKGSTLRKLALRQVDSEAKSYMAVLQAADITPPSGVAAPFLVAIVVPAEAMPGSIVTGGSELLPGEHAASVKLAQYVTTVQERCEAVAAASGKAVAPQWLVLVDASAGPVLDAAALPEAAIAAAGLAPSTPARVAAVDLATGLGLTAALVDATKALAAELDVQAVMVERKRGVELVGDLLSSSTAEVSEE